MRYYHFFRLLAVVCFRKKGIHHQKWNVYEPNTVFLQPVAEEEGATTTLSASKEVLKKTEELKRWNYNN